jgi:hypothetical protein
LPGLIEFALRALAIQLKGTGAIFQLAYRSLRAFTRCAGLGDRVAACVFGRTVALQLRFGVTKLALEPLTVTARVTLVHGEAASVRFALAGLGLGALPTHLGIALTLFGHGKLAAHLLDLLPLLGH